MKQVTEIYCHGCWGYVRFVLDTEVNGRHLVLCPKCGHRHWRDVADGKVRDNGKRTEYAPAFDYPCYLDAVWSSEPTVEYRGGSSPDLWESWLSGYYSS